MGGVRTSPALVLLGPGQDPELAEVCIAAPGAGEVLVRVMASGICHTDLTQTSDARVTPILLGHEGAGIVVEVGDGVSTVREGDHVVVNWRPACGECRHCRSGRQQSCDHVTGTVAPRVSLQGVPLAVMLNAGTLCHYAVVPVRGAVAIRRDLPFELAALLGCAVATGLGAALNSAAIHRGDTVVVIGVGGVGLNIVQGAHRRGASAIIAIDVDRGHLAIATALGATHVIDAGTTNDVEAVRTITGDGADHVFEAVGSPDLMVSGLQMLARAGTLILVGAARRPATVAFAPRAFMSQQQRIVGSIYGDIAPDIDLPRFAEWCHDGSLHLDLLHTSTVGLPDTPRLFAHGGAAMTGLRTVVSMVAP